MTFFLAVCVALVVAVPLCRAEWRGGLPRLHLQVAAPWFVLVAAGAQALLVALQAGHLAATLVSTSCLLAFVVLNRHARGWLVAGAGAGLNALAMLLNSGAMPVSAATVLHFGGPALAPGTLLPGTKAAVTDAPALLGMLGDWIIFPVPFNTLGAWSIGDCLIVCGLVLVLWTATGTPRHTIRRFAHVAE